MSRDKICRQCGNIVHGKGLFCDNVCYRLYALQQDQVCEKCGKVYKHYRITRKCPHCMKGEKSASEKKERRAYSPAPKAKSEVPKGKSIEAFEAYCKKMKKAGKERLSYGYWMRYIAK